VTDEMDRRTLVTLLDDFYSDKVTKYSTAAKVESKDLFSPYFEALRMMREGLLTACWNVSTVSLIESHQSL